MKNGKEIYGSAEVEIILFTLSDVITTSGGETGENMDGSGGWDVN